MLNVIDIKNAKWQNSKKTLVELEVDFDGIEGPGKYVPFAIDFSDNAQLEPHAQEIKDWLVQNDDKIAPFEPDIDKLIVIAESVIENDYAAKVQEAVPYTQEEKETFKIQEDEAKAYIDDNNADVPHLAILADIQGISIADLANKIIEKSKAQNLELFRLLSLKQKAKKDISALNRKSKTFDEDIRKIVEGIKW